MKLNAIVVCALLTVTGTGFCEREVAFIGLTGAGAPAIEKGFNRHFLEHLAMMPDVRSLNTIEIANLRERTSGNFNIASMKPTLFASLRRFASDSTLVIWGSIRECSIRPSRFWIVGAGIQSTLTIELSVYNLANRQFIYCGDASITNLKKKWFVLWGSVDKAIQIPAEERAQLLDEIEIKGVYASGRILSTILTHEKTSLTKKGQWPPDIEKKPLEPAASPLLEKKSPLQGSENVEQPVVEEEPVDFEKKDSSRVDESKSPKTIDSLKTK